MRVLDQIAAALETIGAPFALIGGRAVIMRGYVRATLDYDFLTTDPRVLDPSSWRDLAVQGVVVDCRRGDLDDPVAGVARLTFENGDQADVLVAKWKWEAAIIARAEPIEVDGRTIPVPVTSDLILLKLAAGGVMDLQDATILLRAGDRERLVAEVEGHLGELDADAESAWGRVKADSARLR
jgi:hypothetical protein